MLTSVQMETWHYRQLLDSQPLIFCPNKKCSARLVLNEDGQQQAECPSCHKLLCGGCKSMWHDGYTCEQFQVRLLNRCRISLIPQALPADEREPEDFQLLELAKNEGWRRCPACHVMVELAQGCYHLTCRCRAEWCMLCGGGWYVPSSLSDLSSSRRRNKATNQCTTVPPCLLWDENNLVGGRPGQAVNRARLAQQQRALNPAPVVAPPAIARPPVARLGYAAIAPIPGYGPFVYPDRRMQQDQNQNVLLGVQRAAEQYDAQQVHRLEEQRQLDEQDRLDEENRIREQNRFEQNREMQQERLGQEDRRLEYFQMMGNYRQGQEDEREKQQVRDDEIQRRNRNEQYDRQEMDWILNARTFLCPPVPTDHEQDTAAGTLSRKGSSFGESAATAARVHSRASTTSSGTSRILATTAIITAATSSSLPRRRSTSTATTIPRRDSSSTPPGARTTTPHHTSIRRQHNGSRPLASTRDEIQKLNLETRIARMGFVPTMLARLARRTLSLPRDQAIGPSRAYASVPSSKAGKAPPKAGSRQKVAQASVRGSGRDAGTTDTRMDTIRQVRTLSSIPK